MSKGLKGGPALMFTWTSLAVLLLAGCSPVLPASSTQTATPPPEPSASPSPTPEPSQVPLTSVTPTPLEEPAGKIVLTCQVFAVQQRDQICIMNADGSGYRQLTSDDEFENYYPSLSPDGNSLVYASKRSGSFEIYEMDLAALAPVRLTHGIGEVAAPEISPDGRWIVFTDLFNSLTRIWVMDRDGSHPHQVYARSGADSLDPTWSPDGTKILFASGAGTDKQLYTINPDGTDLHLVSSEFYTRGRSDWSPDGALIASYHGSPWQWSMFLMNADGTNLHQIQVGGVALAPAFSPDGQWIVFTGYLDNPGNPDGCEIYVMRLNGSQLTRLTYNNYCDWQPRWGP